MKIKKLFQTVKPFDIWDVLDNHKNLGLLKRLDINEPCSATGWTPLTVMALQGDVEMVKALLKV